MSQEEVKRIWLGAVVVILASTYPSWINCGGTNHTSYDAPWIYPSNNPVVQSELHAGSLDPAGKISFAK